MPPRAAWSLLSYLLSNQSRVSPPHLQLELRLLPGATLVGLRNPSIRSTQLSSLDLLLTSGLQNLTEPMTGYKELAASSNRNMDSQSEAWSSEMVRD